ncbi:hypothetical protein IFM89_009492 [Coptis chinensis]|uniref:Factor of DNA methylation 1-5/IDN2 domain-containing protein n=1 Tax=Coptis chinensis TaxID=261450 RepID=A0A835I1N9_9MAGN|nr:hypothetical protein IFM89_009492 [Coptis chinensis]
MEVRYHGKAVAKGSLVASTDIKPFRIARYRKYPSNIADDKAAQLCSLWQARLGDSNWYPFKVVHCGADEERRGT